MKTLKTVSALPSPVAAMSLRGSLAATMLVLLSIVWALAASAANLIANPGFEANPPANMGNNIGHGITPWIIGSGGSSNVVKVDGPGGYDYFSNGPEMDGSLAGAGKPQHYLDIANASNALYQSFKVPTCSAGPDGTSVTVKFSGKFSNRANSSGNGKIEILSGSGTGGTVLSSQVVALPAAPSKTTPWTLVSGTANIARGATFTYLVTMDNNLNFDEAEVSIEADPCAEVDTGEGDENVGGCVSPDVKVTCGKRPGTYVITLNANTGNGFTPKFVEIAVLTPGVTIQNPKPKYLVGPGGKVQVTLVGAKPGDVIEFDISGSRPNPKSEDGLSVCCAGKIKVTIPRGLECEKSRIDITKVCGPARLSKYALGPAIDAYGYNARCTITVTTHGPQSGTLTMTDSLTGGSGSWLQSTSTPAWTCTGSSCSINGGNLSPVSSVSTFNVTVGFANAGSAAEAKNCARVGQPAKEACDDFTVEETKSDIKITKVCDPAVEVVGAINHFESKCHITVTTTGPQSGTITVNDQLSGVSGPSVTSMASTTTPPWTCSGTSCSINGGTLNQTSSTSVIDAVVSFPSQGHTMEVENCATMAVAGVEKGKSCTPFTTADEIGRLVVKKETLYNGRHITSQTFPVTVTCGGVSNNGTVADGTPYFTPGAIPVGSNCTVVEAQTVPAAGLCPEGTTASWATSYAPSATVPLTVGLSTVTITNALICKPVIIKVDPPKCDRETTKLVGGECRCTIEGMVKVSKTRCACPDDKVLRNGACRQKRIECPPRTHLEGKRCVPDAVVCKKPLVRNPKTNTCVVVRPVCKRDQRYDRRTNTCVNVRIECPPGTVFNRKRNRCDKVEQRCPEGTIKTKRGCIEVPRCRPPMVPMQGTNRCINPFELFKDREDKERG